MAFLPVCPTFSCSARQLFSSASASFTTKDTCSRCSLFTALEARISEMETCLQTLENPVASQAPVVSPAKGSKATVSFPPRLCPKQLEKTGRLGDVEGEV